MLEDEELRMMQALGASKDIRTYCEKECPVRGCYAKNKDPLKCWIIQREFGLL